MPHSSTARSPQVPARIAAVLYLSLIPFGVFGLMYTQMAVWVPDDPAATFARLQSAAGMMRLSAASVLLSMLINVALVLVLQHLLRPVNAGVARLMVLFYVLSVPIAMLGESARLLAVHLASGADYLAAFTAEQLQAQALLWLTVHKLGITIASIFWGLWLFPMGWLVYRSGFLPRVIGVLLMIGCFGYLIDAFSFILAPERELTLAQYLFWGEVALPLWLLIRGVNVARWTERAQAAAATH